MQSTPDTTPGYDSGYDSGYDPRPGQVRRERSGRAADFALGGERFVTPGVDQRETGDRVPG